MDVYTEVKQRVPLIDALTLFGVEAKARGNIKCPLPGHDDGTASFHYYPDTDSFNCFGCGIGGTVIDFVMAYYSVGKHEACKILDTDFRLGLFDGDCKPDTSLLDEKRQTKARHETILIVAGRVFDFLCHMYTIGEWVLDKKNDLQPKMHPDSSMKIYPIYAKYLQCHGDIGRHKEALFRYLNDYEHWRGKGDIEQEQAAIDNIQLIVNGYAEGEDYAEWRKHNE